MKRGPITPDELRAIVTAVLIVALVAGAFSAAHAEAHTEPRAERPRCPRTFSVSKWVLQ